MDLLKERAKDKFEQDAKYFKKKTEDVTKEIMEINDKTEA